MGVKKETEKEKEKEKGKDCEEYRPDDAKDGTDQEVSEGENHTGK